MIDVAVTDGDGKPVRDLGPSDFTILAGSETRTISTFAAVDALSGATRTAAPLPLPMKIDPGEVHRAFAVIVDDAGISAGDASELRNALLKFVDDGISPRDTVVLFRTSSGASTLERLTSDKAAMRAAIQRIVFNPAAVQPSVPPWPETVQLVLGALRAIEGRKAVILFCHRMPQTCAFAPAVALANRAAANVYVMRAGNALALPACFGELVGGTGGLVLAEGVSAALARTAADQASYYLLGFSPGGAAGTALSVKAARPGLHVRARKQPLGIKTPPLLLETASPQMELRRVMLTPLEAGSVRLRISAAFRRTAAGNRLELSLLVDGRDISFTHRLNGNYEAGLDVLVRLFDAAGTPIGERSDAATLASTAEEYRRVVDEGLALALAQPVAKPGVFQVYAGVRDATSSNTGICHALVEVPDLSKGDLVVSGIRLFPAAAANGSDELQEMESARRVFGPGEQIAYNCAIYNAQPDEHNMAHLEVSTVMYAEGRAVYRSAPTPVTSDTRGNAWLTLRGKLELGQHTAPGQFIFQVLVADKVKPRTASQWIGFTLK